jgi:hypothetical protein
MIPRTSHLYKPTRLTPVFVVQLLGLRSKLIVDKALQESNSGLNIVIRSLYGPY